MASVVLSAVGDRAFVEAWTSGRLMVARSRVSGNTCPPVGGGPATKSPIALRLAKESVLRIEGDEMMERYRSENDYTSRFAGVSDSTGDAACCS